MHPDRRLKRLHTFDLKTPKQRRPAVKVAVRQMKPDTRKVLLPWK